MLNRIHQWSALLIAIFLTMHLFNHLLALVGPDVHIAWMERFRVLYRSLLFEVALLAAVMVQIASGIFFAIRRWERRESPYEQLQVWAGMYLVFFLSVHMIDVMSARMTHAMDTNYWFVVADIRAALLPALKLLFYFLGIVAVSIHLACGVYWLLCRTGETPQRRMVAISIAISGIVIAVLIVLGFSGILYPVELPRDYRGVL